MKHIPLAALAVLLSNSAYAHTVHIKEPEIEKGVLHVHNIAAGNFDDDDSFGNELEVSYGFTDWMSAEIAHVSGDHEGEKYDWYTGGEVALQFKLFDEGQYRPITSVRTSYDWHAQSDHPQNIEVMGIFGKQIGQFNNVINLGFSYNVGENAEGGIGFDAAARSVYEFNHHYGLGFEYFGEFGQIDDMEKFDRQGHQLGPIFTFAPFEEIHMHNSIAYLFGLSEDAPDGTLKLEVGFEF